MVVEENDKAFYDLNDRENTQQIEVFLPNLIHFAAVGPI